MEKATGIKSHIPNFITSLNLFSGCLALMFASEGNLVYAAVLIGIASVFDFMDGMTARLLKAYSSIGKELDSLADMVSFGVVPAYILFQLMKNTLQSNTLTVDSSISNTLFVCVPFIVAVFSGLRLAKFNVDTRQTESFIGLPTPANAIFIGSFPLLLAYGNSDFIKDLILNKYFLVAISLFQSFMLVSEFPMFSLKIKGLGFSQNKIRYIFLIICILLVVFFNVTAIPLIILFFILLSAINNWVYKF